MCALARDLVKISLRRSKFLIFTCSFKKKSYLLLTSKSWSRFSSVWELQAGWVIQNLKIWKKLTGYKFTISESYSVQDQPKLLWFQVLAFEMLSIHTKKVSQSQFLSTNSTQILYLESWNHSEGSLFWTQNNQTENNPTPL